MRRALPAILASLALLAVATPAATATSFCGGLSSGGTCVGAYVYVCTQSYCHPHATYVCVGLYDGFCQGVQAGLPP
ncbi:MAG TPA: hypothetical protein VHH36_07410 [Candidatus Thermoplasmatota archaeon]|nr:hypothetical protein [Candidatus Thermoplasmatota archaeon]